MDEREKTTADSGRGTPSAGWAGAPDSVRIRKKERKKKITPPETKTLIPQPTHTRKTLDLDGQNSKSHFITEGQIVWVVGGVE